MNLPASLDVILRVLVLGINVFAMLKRVGLLIAAICCLSLPVFALEEITNYEVAVVVMPGGELHITESITVIAEGKKIKRGIYRDFPTTYRDRYGNRVRVKFEVRDVRVDGAKESYHFKSLSNGVRTYIGRKDHFVSRGEHTYTIKYVTDRQLGFFDKHDELYFNAIPHDFEFPIRQAKVDVYMPSEVLESDMTLSAYTGRQGTKHQNYVAQKRGSIASFTLTQPLRAFEGMTIVVEFPKGIVREPTDSDRFMWFMKDNAGTIVMLFGTCLVILYFILAWMKVGRDPKSNTVIPRWEPPQNYSAADVRYVLMRRCDNTVIAACVVEAAVKGWITIEDEGVLFSKKTLVKSSGEEPLSKEAQTFYDTLFASSSSVELDNENHSVIRRAITATEKSLEAEHKKRSFVLNRGFFYFGLFLSALSIVGGGIINALSGLEFISMAMFVIIPVLVIVCFFFKWLLEAPTRSGRADLDAISGFKQYLDTAERDTFAKLGAPDDSLQIYEMFLPFAVALGVDYAWGKRFKNIIRQAIANNEVDEHRASMYEDSYTNRWFKSDGISQGLTSAISSSSTPPGSSSGGGGFSGGGGGGGGGGGW